MYVKHFPGHPVEWIVPVFASSSNSSDVETGSVIDAVIDTGATGSSIEEDFAKTELGLVPTQTTPLAIPGPQGLVYIHVGIVPVYVTVGIESQQEIRKYVLATLLPEVDPRPNIKIILGMDFLKDVDMIYFARPHKATFMMSQPPVDLQLIEGYI